MNATPKTTITGAGAVVITLVLLSATVLEVSNAYSQENVGGADIDFSQNELTVYDAGVAEFKKILILQGWEKADIRITGFCDQEYAEDFYHDLVVTRLNFLHRRGLLDTSIQEGRYIKQLENIRDHMPDPEMVEGVAEKMQSQCKLRAQ